MITYNDIYDAARKERYSDQLQPLPKNFLEEVASYLREKREIAAKKDDFFSENSFKTKKQLENASTLFRELILRRRRKILNLVLISPEAGIPRDEVNNLLFFERDLFNDLSKCLEISEAKVNDLFNQYVENSKKNERICFLENVEEFIDLEGNPLGPFSKGDKIVIAKEISQILVEGGKAKIFFED